MAWLAGVLGESGGTAAAGSTAAGAGTAAAGAGEAGAAAQTAAAASEAAGATGVGGMSAAGAGGAGMSAAAPGAAVGTGAPSAAAGIADAAHTAATSATSAGEAAPSGGSVAAGTTPGSGFSGQQGFVGGIVQGLLGTGYKPHGSGGEAMQPQTKTVGTVPQPGSTEATLGEMPKGFLGLTDGDRRALLGYGLSSMAKESALQQQGVTLSGQGSPGGQVMPLDQNSGLAMMADGGDIPQGGSAVVGENGPEIATAHPGGGASITPYYLAKPGGADQPQQAPQAKPGEQPVRAGQAPESSGLWPHIGAHLEDALIFVSALRNPDMFLQMRNMKYNRALGLAQMGAKNPELLESSPAVAGAVDSFLGAGSSAYLSPTGHNRRVADAFGIQLTEPGTQLQDGSTAPSVASQIMRARPDIGFTLDQKGYLIGKTAPASFADKASVTAWNTWQSEYSRLTQNGMDHARASQQAALLAIRTTPLPPRELYNVALGDVTAEQAQEGRNRSNIRNNFQLHAQSAAGTEAGKTGQMRAEAEGAAGAGAVNLGPRPSKETLQSYQAREGWTQTTDQAGNVIMKPPTPPAGSSVDIKNAPAPQGFDPQVWSSLNEDERGAIIRSIGTPVTTPEGVSPGVSVAKPETIRAYNAMSDMLHQLADPAVAATFPSEAGARELGRVKAMTFDQAVANLTDPAKTETARRLADSVKLMLDRLETGGVPRNQTVINAVEGLLGGIRDRSITREQYTERMVALSRLATKYDPTAPLVAQQPPTEKEIRGSLSPDEQAVRDRLGKGEFKAQPAHPAAQPQQRGGAPVRGAAASRATGGTLKNLEAQLDPLVASGKITRAQAVKKLRAAAAAGLPAE